ncbi:MFS transporter [Rhizobium laguerreae]|uniref:MFS transporter n=1 Tax=Rhizobium laguerreae TaxID=1076926 RepID=UPI001C92AB3C|nr:MFS transporter [Rhizobium laguerreae]
MSSRNISVGNRGRVFAAQDIKGCAVPLQRLVMLIFFLQPIAFGAWLPRIPDIQAKLELGTADLAVALLGLPIGTLITLPFAGRLVSRIGGRMAIIYGFIFFLAVVSLPAFAPSVMLLFFALIVVGVALSTVELGMNVEADVTEKATGLIIMSRCHGFWSFGIMAGSLIGVGAIALGLSPHWSILITAIVILPAALIASLRLPKLPESHHAENSQAMTGFKLPSLALLGICAFVFGVTMTEGAIADWSAVYLRDVMNAEGAQTGLGYSVFAFMVAAGRFSGDYMKGRFGAVAIARGCGIASLAGMLVVLLAPATPLALLGFAAVGIGVSVGFPLAVTAVASLTDRPPASSVATLSFAALTGFLIGPPIIGFLGELLGLRAGLAVLLAPLFVSLLCTRLLIPTQKDMAGDLVEREAV